MLLNLIAELIGIYTVINTLNPWPFLVIYFSQNNSSYSDDVLLKGILWKGEIFQVFDDLVIEFEDENNDSMGVHRKGGKIPLTIHNDV